MVIGVVCILLGLAQVPSASTLRIEVRAEDAPVPAATVTINRVVHTTDATGTLTIAAAEGEHRIDVTKDGFFAASQTIRVVAGQSAHVIVDLQPQEVHEEEITVAATRTGRGLDEQPVRVEVLDREEIEEKALMTPGDIVMMLNEMGGLRVQATSPSLGASSVRIQGMLGRYTRFLSDGLPLFGEQSGGLGLLQIPPMDLGQVEVIKGGASALYGAGAMGGIVNLVSRRPGAEPVREVLLNATSRGGTDAVLWLETPLRGRWAGTLLAAGHGQRRADANDDGWADLPGYTRVVARPRVFWTGENGATFFGTLGTTWEDRDGGTMPDRVLPGTGATYLEALDTRRVDAGAVGQFIWRGRYVVAARGAASRTAHDQQYGEILERDRHAMLFGETTIRGSAGSHVWVAGAAIERDAYVPRDVPRFAHAFVTPGVFLQDDWNVSKWLATSGSARLDHHSRYGWFFSPRLSALARFAPWTLRASAATGFVGPAALTEETEAAGLSRLRIPAALRPERGRTGSIDLTHTRGPVSATATVFGSHIRNPVDVVRDNTYELRNLSEPTTNVGVELLGTLRRGPLVGTASYIYVRSRQGEGLERAEAPLTPRHAAGIAAMWEGATRVGVELYYTGTQRLEENPFRERSEPYVIFGVLVERRVGRVRLFVNGENLTDARQTRWSPLLRPSRAADGRWTVDAWAPLEGRTINGGVRFSF